MQIKLIQIPDFTVWNRDKDEMWEELETLLTAGHRMELRMSTSTSLTRDLAWVMQFSNATPRCRHHVYSRLDEYEDVRIMVSLRLEEKKEETE